MAAGGSFGSSAVGRRRQAVLFFCRLPFAVCRLRFAAGGVFSLFQAPPGRLSRLRTANAASIIQALELIAKSNFFHRLAK
jgi:hypothetical protein